MSEKFLLNEYHFWRHLYEVTKKMTPVHSPDRLLAFAEMHIAALNYYDRFKQTHQFASQRKNRYESPNGFRF
jgi:hypothetical protein